MPKNAAEAFEQALNKRANMNWSEGKRLYGPIARRHVGRIAKDLEWNIEGAMWFCLFLLEDVNAHSEAAAVKKLFDRMDWGASEGPEEENPEMDDGDYLDRKFMPRQANQDRKIMLDLSDLTDDSTPVSLADFIEDNSGTGVVPIDPEDISALRKLRPGQTIRLGIGGGAVEIRRIG